MCLIICQWLPLAAVAAAAIAALLAAAVMILGFFEGPAFEKRLA
jgi:hypothetical protein